ncbi:MAG TPA: hypothetical protein VFO63_13190 [Blastocatellia bacterium]|nr:hypothetical protein [Blastocatellia bacterium]
MRKQAYTLFATASLVLALAAISVHAQSARLVVADIPFNFTVKNRTLPAGEYTVEPIQIGGAPALRIQSRDGRITAMVQARFSKDGESKAEPKLIFNRFGEQYFMAQALGFEENVIYTLPKSRAEEALARGKGDPKRQTVSVTGRHQGK